MITAPLLCKNIFYFAKTPKRPLLKVYGDLNLRFGKKIIIIIIKIPWSNVTFAETEIKTVPFPSKYTKPLKGNTTK